MLDRLEQIEARYEELTNQLSSPELLANPSAYGKAAKQHRSLGEMVDKYRQWKSLKEELAGARELLETGEDEEMRQMAYTEITSLEGAEQLERVVWKTAPGNVLETHAIGHVFLMTGAVPSTHWLKGCIALNDKGFVRTGSDLTPADLPAANGSTARPLQSFETNWPGIFAVGDVRCGSVKRVAAAVGEGSACVQQVHQALHD